MTASVVLSPAEVLLFEIMYREHQESVAAADALLKQRTAAIYASHGLDHSIPGHFQVDPLDRAVVRFLYDDGTAPA